MIFTHPYYFEEIQLSSDQPYTLIVEDGFMYRNLIHELLIQNQSGTGDFYLSDNGEELDIAHVMTIITDLFSVDPNDRKIITRLIQDIAKEYAGTQAFYDVLKALNKFGCIVCDNSSFPLVFNDVVQIPDVAKLLAFHFDEQCEDLMDEFLQYCNLSMQILKKKLFVTVGLKDIINSNEYEATIKTACYQHIPLLMIERHTHDEMDDPKNMTIIDKDMCVL